MYRNNNDSRTDSLQERWIGIKVLFIVMSLHLMFVVSSCRDSDKNGSKENNISNENTSDVPDTLGNHSLLNAIHKANKARTGDFNIMLKHRIIRILVPYSRTLFFNDHGREYGFSAEAGRDFELFLNRKYKKKLQSIPFTIVFIPTPRDKLISGVVQGLGDIAAGNLTVTEDRKRQADFFSPMKELMVAEIVLTKKGDSITNVEQLSGKTIYVRKSSSYYTSLQLLNKKLSGKGKEPARLVIVSENLEDEDLMEMLNAGIFSYIVVDDWKAKMWVQVLPNIQLNEKAALHSGGQIGWAYRKKSPLLTAELQDFYTHYVEAHGLIPYRFKKYNELIKVLQDPTKSDKEKRFREIIKLLEKYGDQYGFDPLMLAALGFQESKLNQKLRSPVGAIGVMQLMPKTGASMKVGNITITEPNIHAGTKYMHTLMTTYFGDAHFDEFNKSVFAFASYNAGPNRIARLRKIAAERGLNPDVWLNNVEIVASEEIGSETTTYVRNIVKYYYSYKLISQLGNEQRKHR